MIDQLFVNKNRESNNLQLLELEKNIKLTITKTYNLIDKALEIETKYFNYTELKDFLLNTHASKYSFGFYFEDEIKEGAIKKEEYDYLYDITNITLSPDCKIFQYTLVFNTFKNDTLDYTEHIQMEALNDTKFKEWYEYDVNYPERYVYSIKTCDAIVELDLLLNRYKVKDIILLNNFKYKYECEDNTVIYKTIHLDYIYYKNDGLFA